METIIDIERLITAAEAQEGDPGWQMTVVPAGIRLKYTWEQWPRGSNHFLTVESITPWAGIVTAVSNPLIYAMSDLKEQKRQHEEVGKNV